MRIQDNYQTWTDRLLPISDCWTTVQICLPAEEVGQLLAKHHGKFACAFLIGFIHALTSAKWTSLHHRIWMLSKNKIVKRFSQKIAQYIFIAGSFLWWLICYSEFTVFEIARRFLFSLTIAIKLVAPKIWAPLLLIGSSTSLPFSDGVLSERFIRCKPNAPIFHICANICAYYNDVVPNYISSQQMRRGKHIIKFVQLLVLHIGTLCFQTVQYWCGEKYWNCCPLKIVQQGFVLNIVLFTRWTEIFANFKRYLILSSLKCIPLDEFQCRPYFIGVSNI